MELEEFTANVMPLKDKLFRFAKRLMQDHEEAEDLLQDVMVKLWVNRAELSKKSSVEAFAMAVTKNLCIDRFRSKQYQYSNTGIDAAELDLSDRGISPHARAEQLEAVELVHRAIDSLPPSLKSVIELRDLQGLSYQEIADVMSMNINTLKVNLSRARKKIREILSTNYNFNYNEK
ncbi:MAG: RNA polymerase sigma factor [Candidatus Kapabacteria bacterium]|nr:RNA polymerase sigma factor [Ignavibacteriota bacterium]MCW5884305.1 RNA polymerase sigma factor [Candidatus Kapabacteria bacterium]